MCIMIAQDPDKSTPLLTTYDDASQETHKPAQTPLP